MVSWKVVVLAVVRRRLGGIFALQSVQKQMVSGTLRLLEVGDR